MATLVFLLKTFLLTIFLISVALLNSKNEIRNMKNIVKYNPATLEIKSTVNFLCSTIRTSRLTTNHG